MPRGDPLQSAARLDLGGAPGDGPRAMRPRPRPASCFIVAGLIAGAATAAAIAHDLRLPSPVEYDRRNYGPAEPLATIVERQCAPIVGGRLFGARLVLFKSRRQLRLYSSETLLKTYRVQLGREPQGEKERARDGRTPEGEYHICAHRPSKYHLALTIDYPNREDVARSLARKAITPGEAERFHAALEAGRCPPQNSRLGGWILIHGQDPGVTRDLARQQRAARQRIRRGHEPGDIDPATLTHSYDWTSGCVAVTNPDIRELFEFVPDGAAISIRP